MPRQVWNFPQALRHSIFFFLAKCLSLFLDILAIHFVHLVKTDFILVAISVRSIPQDFFTVVIIHLTHYISRLLGVPCVSEEYSWERFQVAPCFLTFWSWWRCWTQSEVGQVFMETTLAYVEPAVKPLDCVTCCHRLWQSGFSHSYYQPNDYVTWWSKAVVFGIVVMTQSTITFSLPGSR